MSSRGLIGSQLGNYTVQRLLGEGGMGAVYEGQHRFLGDRVAIKVLHGSYAHSPEMSQRFFQEAKSAREIGHPSIIRVIDFGQSPDDGCLYLVMELLDGRSLASVAAQGPMAELQAARIIAAVADGVQAAHDKGVIHRDLKPDNIFLVGDGVKVLDFGIAKVVSSSQNTGTGAMLGTPRYMAPEQARGTRLVGPQSDVYSLGVILFQLITGKVPFDGEMTEVLLKVLSAEPPRPSSLARVSPEMEALILSCMAKEPAGRPASMLDLRARLTPWAGPPDNPERLSNAATIAMMAVDPVRADSTLSSAAGERRDATVVDANATSPRRPLLFAAGAALVVAATLGVLLLGRGQPTTGATTRAAPATSAPAIATPPTAPTVTPTPSADPADSPATPQTVRVTVRTEPAGAQLFDENMKPLGESPKILSVTLPFEIHATLDDKKGHEVISRAALGTGDEFVIKLERSGARPGKLRPGDAPRPRPTSPTRPPPSLKPGESTLDN